MQYILFALLFSAGVYIIFSAVFPVASRHSSNAVALNKGRGYNKRYGQLLDAVGKQTGRYIHIPMHKAERHQKMLTAAGEKLSANEYISRLVGQSLLYVVFGIFLYPILPLLTLLCVAFGLYTYQSETCKLKGRYLMHQQEIELDLPKLCSVINSRLRTTKNVQMILESFMPIASTAMQEEITVTVRDMKTGSPEMALRRFEGRLSSPKVSDVTRGLISVLNGDDQTIFFQSRQHQFNDDYLTIRKKEIQKRPWKLTMPSMLAFVFFFIIIFYPILMSTGTVMNNIF